MNAQLLFLFKSLFWLLVFLGRPTTQQQQHHQRQQHGVKLGSILKGKAFTTVWNAPTELCSKRYNISLDLNVFDIVINPNECFCGDNMTIFYHTQLGYYPYIDEHGALKNGGVPQSGDLAGHLGKAREDIRAKIKGKDFEGLAVIDWEEWRPQWSRNWGKKDEYRKESKTKVKHAHPSWPEDLVAKEAQKEFDKSARDFMEQTARVGQSERPGGLWGYYLFPDCYNYDYNKTGPEYTGQCPDVERVRNDQLLWLWNSSTALYPSIYLERPLKSTKYVRKFVHHRVKEAMRVASMPKPGSIIPVLVYARIVYTYTLDFLSQVDLMHTVGETVSQGASGIILWGDHLYAKSADNCRAVKAYVDDILGPYLINVTAAAKLCSEALCEAHGRCVRKHPSSTAHLHLNPASFRIAPPEASADRRRGRWQDRVVGRLHRSDVRAMKEAFRCQCYAGWEGARCELPMGRKRMSACHVALHNCWVVGLLLFLFLAM
ncbi:hyaluronidase-1-like [Lethenteron reissneri]|uniref:hyaluronidase-1-like n=1 Tax=Lethenteron reissneri TaxID=7753 RepID=UPI002AB745EE|nr:hyaluronidase-1-like [Lethenteron reissneri]XP_061407790.1 hyaluronidase-1-like [Lethenteron reissneri]XP_061407791.1 hyaluronidase-1-like [Lethenteron reissneri]XP_061407792.1 hyaluronidase-1-like [Lethenteron reissneri]